MARDDDYERGSRKSDFEDSSGRFGKGKKRKPKRMNFRKRRPPANLRFDYKDVQTLMSFLTEEGKIVPARVSGLSAFQQRQLTLAIKRARNLAFINPLRRESVQ
jgi:small subunit ribosomal protein S18